MGWKKKLIIYQNFQFRHVHNQHIDIGIFFSGVINLHFVDAFILKKKTFSFKISESSSLSSNKCVTNRIVFSPSLREKGRKEKNSNEFMQNKEEQKKYSAALIYRTSFKYFVSLSLHSNH